jgi:Ni,Fe-hydrogenase III large subunit
MKTKTFRNGDSFPLSEVPELSLDTFLQGIIDLTGRGWEIAAYFSDPWQSPVPLYAVLSLPGEGQMAMISTVTSGTTFPSLTNVIPQVHMFEREIAEQSGLSPEGHPWLKPVRFHGSYGSEKNRWEQGDLRPGVTDFFALEGEEIHEVAVGPVHAGVIEPGHFRFQCHGEHVYHLEIALGYQHRALESMVRGGPHAKTLYQMETVAGDTTIGHCQAYCMVMEALGSTRPDARADIVRAIALELERLANHTGDLGAIAGDIGYLPTSSFCGRIRGDFLNMTALICGSRFGRGIIRPGGTGFDITPGIADELRKRIAAARADLKGAVDLLWATPSVMARLEETGTVRKEDALALGLVGPPARACGIRRDVRSDHSFGIYRTHQIPLSTADSCDVYARTQVRWLEAAQSMDFIEEQLSQLPGGELRQEIPRPGSHQVAVAMVEGWRGQICHVAITDESGHFARYKIVDPSFHNWMGLAMALREGQISDFPLCNKSFNLSYCGFDL